MKIPIPEKIAGRSILTTKSEVDEINAHLKGLGYI
jgi:hypothetical protein